MKDVNILREEVKRIIDTVDPRILKIIYAMLETDNETDFWDDLPHKVKTDIDVALLQSANGEGKPHDEVMKKYKKWITK